VTAVTVAALFMGIGDFAAKVNRDFEVAVQTPGLMSIKEQREAKEVKEKQEEERELRELMSIRQGKDQEDSDANQ